jgi:hypothetical protein
MAEPVNIILRRKPQKKLRKVKAAAPAGSAAAFQKAAAPQIQPETAEQKKTAALQKALKEFVPSDVKNPVFEGRRFAFMLNRRVPAPGIDELAAKSFGVAHEIHSLFQEAGLGAEVTAQFWNSSGLQTADIGNADAYKHLRAGFNFGPVAEQIALDSRSEAEKGKNYIIVTTGDFVGDVDGLAHKLSLLSLNPAATMDFIVRSEPGTRTKVDDLMEKLEEICGPQIRRQVDMTKGLVSPERAVEVMKGTVRARAVSGRGGYGQLFSAPPQGPAPAAPVKKRWF